MKEVWKQIDGFPNYSVSNLGNVRSDWTERILIAYPNQSGLFQVGMMANGKQYHRSVPLLVMKAFSEQPNGAFDTPINKDGDRSNNRLGNLEWRPRWFAAKFNRQFREIYENHIASPIEDIVSGEVSNDSLSCAKRYGLLEDEIVLAILNNTYVWPTYQRFRLVE